VIVGFPGETREEFDVTKAFLEKVHFYEMHVFKYSKREGTKAAVMTGQIEEKEKAARSDELLALEASMSAEYRRSFIGREVSVLFEETVEADGKLCMTGCTPQYVKVALPLKNAEEADRLSGSIFQMKGTGLLSEALLQVEFL
jgi:threonylcarbamoyladenosine tRNA methylthiotransferase MtaB